MLADPGIYLHFPWCVKKCPYCDFNSHPLKTTDDFDVYAVAMLADWHSRSIEGHEYPPFASVFLGGGTPSLFPASVLAKILKVLPLADDAEVTMEANPGTTEYTDFSNYRAIGINRLSIGAQSFDETQLQKLGRIHEARHTKVAFEEARLGGFDNINIDIMWGLIEQSVDQALNDLEQAIALNPDHISWYQLTLEPKTEFHRRPPKLPGEEVLAQIEREGVALLDQHGYIRYEVSAYARNNHRCQHNLNYWQFGDYAGLGAGAHGKESTAKQIERTVTASQPRLYQADPKITKRDLVVDIVFEFMLNALRLTDGVSWQTFERNTGLARNACDPLWSSLVNRGLVMEDRVCTTSLGYQYLDSVVGEFIS